MTRPRIRGAYACPVCRSLSHSVKDCTDARAVEHWRLEAARLHAEAGALAADPTPANVRASTLRTRHAKRCEARARLIAEHVARRAS